MTFKVHNALYKYSLSNIMIILALEKNEVGCWQKKKSAAGNNHIKWIK